VLRASDATTLHEDEDDDASEDEGKNYTDNLLSTIYLT
jgi:hypothetical protein